MNAEPTGAAAAALCRPPLCKRRLRRKTYRRFLDVEVMFLLSLATLVVFIVMSVVNHNAAVTKTRLLHNHEI